ncbi:hypothetical protein Taro_034334 [Colocasia esculenta]|uniref:Uncharacterized protein n=1 Tax=Colocasia esculenta TaxID=4460 RepID=A0A843WBM6_COLES|nr:hypothetical protein [Colocasia esculenta]
MQRNFYAGGRVTGIRYILYQWNEEGTAFMVWLPNDGGEIAGGVRRVLNATAVGVAFWLPLLGSTSACAPRVAHGVEFADVGNGKCVAEFGGPVPIPECLFSWEPQVLCEHTPVYARGLSRCSGAVKLDLTSVTARLRGGGTVVFVFQWWYLVVVDPEMVPGLGFSPEKAMDPAVSTSLSRVVALCFPPRALLLVVAFVSCGFIRRGGGTVVFVFQWWYLVVVGFTNGVACKDAVTDLYHQQ